jgi:hypothetical protein
MSDLIAEAALLLISVTAGVAAIHYLRLQFSAAGSIRMQRLQVRGQSKARQKAVVLVGDHAIHVVRRFRAQAELALRRLAEGHDAAAIVDELTKARDNSLSELSKTHAPPMPTLYQSIGSGRGGASSGIRMRAAREELTALFRDATSVPVALTGAASDGLVSIEKAATDGEWLPQDLQLMVFDVAEAAQDAVVHTFRQVLN